MAAGRQCCQKHDVVVTNNAGNALVTNFIIQLSISAFCNNSETLIVMERLYLVSDSFNYSVFSVM